MKPNNLKTLHLKKVGNSIGVAEPIRWQHLHYTSSIPLELDRNSELYRSANVPHIGPQMILIKTKDSELPSLNADIFIKAIFNNSNGLQLAFSILSTTFCC